MSENHSPEKSERKLVQFYVPDYVYWKIEKRIGGNNVNALMKLFAHQFSRGAAGLNIDFQLTQEDVIKLEKNRDTMDVTKKKAAI